jgi:exopolysaccharide production protein ExoQ
MFTDGGASRSRHREIGDRFDVAFVAVAMLTSLLPLFIGSLTGVLYIALPVLFAYYRFERLEPLLVRTWPLLAIGAWAVVSALWSPHPGDSVYYGLQLGLTILVACMIGAGTRPEATIYGLFVAMFVHGMLVAIRGLLNGDLSLTQQEYAFVGLAGSKNTTADMASLGIMCALAMLATGIGRVRPLAVMLALLLIAVDLVVIIAARSAGANAAVAVASAVFLLWWTTARWPVRGRSSVMAAAVIGAVAAVLSKPIWYPILFERFLEIAGKEDSLTGRTYIWSRAEVLIDQAPWFGRGFASFWVEGELEPTAIWDAMYVENHLGFNFHSSVYEILVYFGWVGLIAMSAIFIGYTILLARRLVLEPKPVTILFAAIIVYDGLRFSFESLPLGLFSHNMMFLYGALAHGVGLEFRQRPRKASQVIAPPGKSGPLRTGISR